jgi:hypothetical protein
MSPAGSRDGDNRRGRPASPDEIDTGRVVVAMRVPARPEYVAMLRATCGRLAAQMGCTRTEIADLQLAVDEASAFLLCNCIAPRGATAPDALSATFVIDGHSLHVAVTRQAEIFLTPDSDEFGWTFLTALVDGFVCRVEESAVHMEFRKQHRDGR